MPVLNFINSVTVGSGGTSAITFSSIPGTYNDLLIIGSLRSDRNSYDRAPTTMRLNGDTGNNYSWRTVSGVNGSVSSFSGSSASYVQIGNATSIAGTTNTFASFTIYIPNYAGSNTKCLSVEYAQENSGTLAWIMEGVAGLWNSTSAITSITINDLINSSNFTQYSTVYLYGISNA